MPWRISSGEFFRRAKQGSHMMDGMMSGTMAWGMSLAAIVTIAVLVLLVAALVKYVFFR
jgi:hypothetical protein